ncbi:MAG: undecaprenyl-diphosphate phosphatase [Balneolaceae bacterium]|nr:undecaprenyl-diphosphate phosphatase [Balneolaceae bacterium]
MDILQSFLLGLIQGLTEFLPISSSGHLALGRYLLNSDTEMGITFEVVVHFGTLCSIVIYYKTEILNLIKALFRFIGSPSIAKTDKDVKVIGFILISMIPAFIVGFTLKDYIEGIFMNPILVSGMLIVTGIILFLTKFSKNPEGEITTKKAFLIGIAQAFAMIPGISRSGSTISTSLYLGISREEAANFSFLMVIPVIAGAMILQMGEVLEVGISNSQISSLLVGFFTAFISGYYALKYLIIILKKQGFHYFAYYCWVVGGAGLIYFLV